MLDADLKVEKKEAVVYEPLPENIYQVELLDISPVKSVTYDTLTKPDDEKQYETTFTFQFTVLDEQYRVRNFWANLIPSYLYIGKKGKNKLYQIIEALAGREISKEEEATMNSAFLNSLIGKQCKVFVEIYLTQKGNKKNKIMKYMKVDQKMLALTEEEKEKAKVKKDPKDEKFPKDPADLRKMKEPGDKGYIDPEEIPF